MRKNFKDIDVFAGFKAQNGAEWQQANGIAWLADNLKKIVRKIVTARDICVE